MSRDSAARMLQLLSLLQTRQFWAGAELARRLDITQRTLRRDIERLRGLGYRLDGQRGPDGGYQLQAGAELPPLILTDDEAVTLAVSLLTAAISGPLVGMSETGVAVLAKLEQVLPAALRRRVSALQSATVVAEPGGQAITVDPSVLSALALACRDRQRVRIAYRDTAGSVTLRSVEPAALVPHHRRWYLVCWDRSREDWRTFRIDRIERIEETRVVFPERQVPGGNAADFIAEQFVRPALHHAVVMIAAPYAEVFGYLGGWAPGLSEEGPGLTRWDIETERVEAIIGGLAWLIWPFEVYGSDEIDATLTAFTERLRVGVEASENGPP